MNAFARIRKVLSIHDIMHETNSCPARLFTEQMPSSFMENIMHGQKLADPRLCEHLSWLYPPKNEDGHLFHRNGCVGVADMYFNDASCLFNLAYRSYFTIFAKIFASFAITCILQSECEYTLYLRNVINLRSDCE